MIRLINETDLHTGLVSNDPLIDSLVYADGGMPNWNWIDDGTLNHPIYYTFFFGGHDDLALEYGDSSGSAIMFNNQQQMYTRDALTYVDSVTGLNHVEVESAEEAHLIFAYTDLIQPNTTGICYGEYSYGVNSSSGEISDLELRQHVYLDSSPENECIDLAPGGFGYETLLHELGHALGLNHPHKGVELEVAYDTTAFTLMSYQSSGDAFTEYQSIDLSALDWLYGGDGVGGRAYGLNDQEVAVDPCGQFEQGSPAHHFMLLFMTVFGARGLQDALNQVGPYDDYLDQGLILVDAGRSIQQIANIVVESGVVEDFLASFDNVGWVNHIYANVVGSLPSSHTLDVIEYALDSGIYSKQDLLLIGSQGPVLEDQLVSIAASFCS